MIGLYRYKQYSLPGFLLVPALVATVLPEDETSVADQDLVTAAQHGHGHQVHRAVRPQVLVHLKTTGERLQDGQSDFSSFFGVDVDCRMYW